MADFEKALRAELAAKDAVKRYVATFVDSDGVRGRVSIGENIIPVDLCGYLPDVNESVFVLLINGTATLIGPSTLKPGKGTVSAAPSGNLVAVSTTAGTFTLPYASGLSLSVGQVVKLGAWNDGGFVFSIMSTSPPPAAAPPSSGSGGKPQAQTFMPIDGGSYRSGWWTSQVYASDTNTGAWFYGAQIADTIPDGATIQSIEIYISIATLSYQAPNFGLHSSATRPGGNVALSSLTAINIGAGFVALPTSFGDFLKASYGGIGISHGGYAILNSLAADPSSGALRIRWTN